MTRRFAIVILPLAVLILIFVTIRWDLVSGLWSQGASLAANPPFQDKLQVEVGRPIPRFDASPASTALYTHVHVVLASGTSVDLSAEQQPLLFVAYWCPHCQRTLALLNQRQAELGRKPIVVAMGYAPGTTLTQAKRLEQQEEALLQLRGFEVVYALGADAVQYVPMTYPTLVFRGAKGQLESLHSEHTLAVWKRALA